MQVGKLQKLQKTEENRELQRQRTQGKRRMIVQETAAPCEAPCQTQMPEKPMQNPPKRRQACLRYSHALHKTHTHTCMCTFYDLKFLMATNAQQLNI